MKDRPEIVKLVCQPHCRFFRPGAKEDLSCRGFDVIAARATPSQVNKWIEMFAATLPPDSFSHDEQIEKILCAACAFRAADCDFQDPAGPKDAVPCGGYVLLCRLCAAGVTEVREWLK